MTRRNRASSIKNHLIVYSLGVILLMTILSVYALFIMERYRGQIETMFERHIYLSDIQSVISELDDDLLGFLSSKSSTRLNDFNINQQQLTHLLEGDYEHLYSMEDVLMKNIRNLSMEYIDQGRDAISYKRQRNVTRYDESYEKSKHIKTFIFEYIDGLNAIQLSRNSKSYLELVNQTHLLQTITYIIVINLIIISLLIVYLITSRMVKPFRQLSHVAEEISKGNFDTEDIHLEMEDEFQLLAIAFDKMKHNIREYVAEVKIIAETESKLKDEQLKNVKMEHLLDNARLYALQSQINPHFLFNTINAGVQLSIMERATRTGQFLESMSRLFRYNIQKMDSTCTLEEEVTNISDYYDLLKVRFGHRIQFELEIDPLTLHRKVPPLILQPLVENAYIHGLSGLEEGGTIKVATKHLAHEVLITVEDNGRGMDDALIEKILGTHSAHDISQDKEEGIGIRNVRDRLALYFHRTDILTMEGRLNEGVKITIRLPHEM
ncbi:histidine kinase [Vallitalea pronyensis]|uniref:histidine kinase n=1 Tax=Vallitalea pronyensis TaxID=1348613 RepID=A0A8J8SG87_9FIRM|nr:histidine kinase [Vallitalea pronyensis]QUI22331.1 histidine kinase [Vallitalea pronyensis]